LKILHDIDNFLRKNQRKTRVLKPRVRAENASLYGIPVVDRRRSGKGNYGTARAHHVNIYPKIFIKY
jgi:hypothetical protein